MTHPLAALIAGVKVKDFDVEVVRGNSGGNLALYFNDYRVAGSKPWGGGTTIYSFRVQGDDVKSSGILAAMEAVQPPDLVAQAGKVLEGVTPGKWEPHHHDDYSELAVYHPEFTGLGHFYEAADARFIAWCREGVPALIALCQAQAAQIAGLTKERDKAALWATEQHACADSYALRLGQAEAEASTLRDEVERLRGAVELDADLLFDAYKGIMVLHRMLDKSGLEVGAKTATDLMGRIEAAHPEMPGRSALRATRAELEGKA